MFRSSETEFLLCYDCVSIPLAMSESADVLHQPSGSTSIGMNSCFHVRIRTY